MGRSDHLADRSGEQSAAWPWAASLAFAFVAAATPPALAQTTATLPSAEQGSVVLEADSVVRDEETDTVIAEGNVEVRYRGRTLRTQRLTYDLRERRIRAQGSVEIVEPDGTVRFANEVEVDEELNTGVATEFSMRMPGGGTIAAAAIARPKPERNELWRAVYTACPICTVVDGEEKGPTWTLRARRAVQNQDTQMISYRDLVIRVGDVPVLYLPYFTHPDPSSGARSGLLVPDAGRDRRLGLFYEQPIHWVISPSQDLTFSPRVHEQVNPIIGLQYRKRFYSGELRLHGSVTNDQFFDNEGKFGEEAWRGHVFADGEFEINDFWEWGFGVERASDNTFLRRYDIDTEDRARSISVTENLRLLSQVYAVGQNERTYASISTAAFQDLRESDESFGPGSTSSDPAIENSPLILPLGELEHVLRDPVFDGQVRLQASTVALHRENDTQPDSARLSVGGEWRRDRVVGPGLVLSPFAQARTDVYRVAQSPTTDAEDETFARSVAVGGIEARMPFIRPGAVVDAIIEPIAMAAWGTSDGNDPRIVNEDSLSFELDESNLFRPNAAPNFDVWESGPRAALGVQATARSKVGKSASVFVGRRWRDSEAIEDDRPYLSEASNLNDEGSDYVGALTADLGRNFGASVRLRLDDENLDLQRTDAALRASVWRLSGNARYFRVSEDLRASDQPREELRGSLTAKLTDRWQVGYAARHDLDSDTALLQSARLVYQDDCTLFEISYVRTETEFGSLGPSEGIQFRIGLATLGAVGE
jgi:LPS-assembly protein